MKKSKDPAKQDSASNTKQLEHDLRLEIEEQLKPRLEQEIRTKLDAEYIRNFEKEVLILKDANAKQLDQVISDWKKQQVPPNPEELKTLLNQEYIEFEIKVISSEGERVFTIRELPQSIEKKFYKMVKDRLKGKINEIADLTVKIAEGSIEKKIESLVEVIDDSFQILAETVLMILDPFGIEKLTVEWVQNNTSSFRQWNIIVAQERANRLRDFFSHVSQSSLDGMMTGVGSLR